ncbi:MAG: FtsX-like permease family protein [Clostridia bacterium]|nr:FtsX-like permease family protein [Clostridia bacterium]
MNLHGALDTKTSVQVMEILKKISKDKLIIMVTHNPELAEKYSSRIIRILDGLITEDSNPIQDNEVFENVEKNSIGRTSMKFWTAFRLSLNNLLTKKGRTILVSFAGSIGIIGIALVQSVSNGFQAYVDSIQEETLTSYPLSIMEESSDMAGAILSMRPEQGDNSGENKSTLKEEQYITKVLDSLSTNDLKSFKHHLDDNYKKVENDISSIKYGYSVGPNIYGIDTTNKIAKLSPSNLFGNMGSSFGSGMMSTYTSVYSQMMDDKETIEKSYDVLAGHLPEKYDEMIIVLSDRNTISDLLIYSLGLRDTEELTEIVSKLMKGEKADIRNEALNFTYEDLMNKELKLILPTDLYKYNSEYNVYEDMSENKDYMKDLYDNNSIDLKIVGIVTAKEGVTSAALNPGVSYTSELVDYIIDKCSDTEIVKKQLENEEIDIFSNSKFDEKKNGLGLDFKDLISIDSNKLQSAFNIKIDQNQLQNQTQGYMTEISNAINTDINPAREAFMSNLNTLANGVLSSIDSEITVDDIESKVDNYLSGYESSKIVSSLEENYVIPKETFRTAYSGLLKGLLQVYVSSLDATKALMTPNSTQMPTLPEGMENNIPQMPEQTQNSNMIPQIPGGIQNIDIKQTILPKYLESAAIQETGNTMAKAMTEAVMKKTILTKVGELTGNLTNSFASAFNVDQSKIADSFKMKMTEEEITRLITAMLSDTDSSAKTNLISLGYQNKEEPTYISFYFKSFDGKERFKDFINSYNENVKQNGEDDKEIKYTDTTGILMGSVKTIVNAVTYVLIAFISISLVVSSIMIGIITYISVYERTKEIGILRAIGASKRNISSIFNAETFIIGLLSGLIGIGFTYSVIPPINAVLHHFTGNIPLNATFYFSNAVILVVLSVILTLIGGLIPAKAASKKDPVIALRTE